MPLLCWQKVLKGFNDLGTRNPELAKEWHPTKNGNLLPEHVVSQSNKKVWWQCPKGHEWESAIGSRHKNGCDSCRGVAFISKAEQEIADFLAANGLAIKQSVRNVLPRMELDIYIPDKQIAVEFNGVYWHSEKAGKDSAYHYNKYKAAKDKGIQLIQIWEDEWNKNPEIVKNMLLHKCGLSSSRKCFARNAYIRSVTKNVAEDFLNSNHIEGFTSGSHYFGLFEEAGGSLVSLIVLEYRTGNSWNIVRYASSRIVVGGFTKLVRHVERTLHSDSLIAFSDNCVSDGGLYKSNGFVLDKKISPDYRYVVGAERKPKSDYSLKRFSDDSNLLWVDSMSEKELADLNGLSRIWDAGKIRWVRLCQR